MHKLKLRFLDIFTNVFRHIVRFSTPHVGVELMYKKFIQSVITVKCTEPDIFFTKVKTSSIGRLHLYISTTCEINLVRPAVLAVVGLLSLSSFHCHIPLKIKTEWQAVSQIFISAVLLVTSTGCDRL